VRISVCHCLACQRRTGSAFGVQARYARKQSRHFGTSTAYVRKGDSGQSITFHFCSGCGTTLYWELGLHPDFISVAVGAFADPAFPTPGISVYESRRHPWVVVPQRAQHEG
jgi:hypothetical protein